MDMKVGKVLVGTSDNGPLGPEFYAEKLCQQILHIADGAPEEIKMQAHAFRERMKGVIYRTILEALEADRRRMYN